MNPDQSQAQRAETLQTLAAGPLSSSISRLSSSSRGIPSDKDFHFLYNFDEFKVPIQQIAMQSQSMLESIGSSNAVWDKEVKFPGDFDDGDDAYDWLVNVNDEIFERIDVSLDEFQERRKREEESGKPVMEDSDNGFQLVYGKKKGPSQASIHSVSGSVRVGESSLGVKMATRDKKAMGAKPKVPFHIPTIKKPQNEFNILVNNTNQPFEHVWLQRSEDGQRFIHPLEKLSVLEFVDKNIGDVEPVKPPSTESTPFKLVEEVKDLKVLAAKLHGETEFAVDLEHNQYRSFQGLTCLMQISTRTEDFVVDTLKLRIHVGPYLREVFKDPTKKKVMHGADRDIVWLQRDFGIYICNLFDTGQASRVLKLERNSLEYLLHHFCGVTANKEYQNADWRLRPLPDEMLRYAREDTHYLLHIYDIMRINLLSMPKESENSDTTLVEVYKRSYDVCMKFYEKELLTESSYLYIYGVQGAGFNAHQLAIVAGLCEWRDVVARAEDESTGYVLPNKTLLEIAKQMPVTTSKLRRLVKSKHPYVERNLGSVVSIIRHSMQNASAFEDAAEHLKEARVITVSEENLVNDGPESFLPDTPTNIKTLNARRESINGGNAVNGHMPTHSPDSPQHKEQSVELGSSAAELGRDKLGGFFKYPGGNGNITIEPDSNIPGFPKEGPSISGKSGDPDSDMGMSHTVKAAGATVQVLRNPSRAFGALLGNSAPKRKFDTEKKEKDEIKLEQIRSSVNLPFRSFLGRDEELKPVIAEDTRPSENLQPEKPLPMPAAGSNFEDIIVLEDSSDEEEPMHVDAETGNDHREDNSARPALEMDQEDEPMSLSDLSSSFQKCLESTNQNRKSREVEKSQESGGFLQVKPFDYAAAIRFGESNERPRSLPDSRGKKKSSAVGRVQKDDGTSEFPQGRRRQAFPASGNRGATFR